MVCGRLPLVEDDLRWKTTSVGRRPPVEDDLWWKTTFGGRYLRRKTTFGWRRPSEDLACCLLRFAVFLSFGLKNCCSWWKLQFCNRCQFLPCPKNFLKFFKFHLGAFIPRSVVLLICLSVCFYPWCVVWLTSWCNHVVLFLFVQHTIFLLWLLYGNLD